MLETYEAHRESLKAKKPLPAAGGKVSKKVHFFHLISFGFVSLRYLLGY
jgi:hypothetical protein